MSVSHAHPAQTPFDNVYGRPTLPCCYHFAGARNPKHHPTHEPNLLEILWTFVKVLCCLASWIHSAEHGYAKVFIVACTYAQEYVPRYVGAYLRRYVCMTHSARMYICHVHTSICVHVCVSRWVDGMAARSRHSFG